MSRNALPVLEYPAPASWSRVLRTLWSEGCSYYAVDPGEHGAICRAVAPSGAAGRLGVGDPVALRGGEGYAGAVKLVASRTDLERRMGPAVVLVEDQFLGRNPSTMKTLTFRSGVLVGMILQAVPNTVVVLVPPRTWQAIVPPRERRRRETIEAWLKDAALCAAPAGTTKADATGIHAAAGIATWWHQMLAGALVKRSRSEAAKVGHATRAANRMLRGQADGYGELV